MTKTEYRIEGMSCGHCERAVRAEVGRLPGVDRVEVSAASGALVITGETAVQEDEVIAAVAEAGYQARRVR